MNSPSEICDDIVIFCDDIVISTENFVMTVCMCNEFSPKFCDYTVCTVCIMNTPQNFVMIQCVCKINYEMEKETHHSFYHTG